MPAMLQEHLLGNMRDHLRALDEILGLLAEGKVDEAGAPVIPPANAVTRAEDIP